jgi:hypothetical protein
VLRSVKQDLSGKIASDGTATITISNSWPGKFSLVMVSLVHLVNGKLAGNPAAQLVIGAAPLASAVGPHLDLGPRPAGPNEKIEVRIAGGTAGATLIGTLHGSVADSEDELLRASAYSPQPNAVAIQATAPRQKLFPDGTSPLPTDPTTPSFTVGAFATVAKRFTLPPGTVQLRIAANAGPVDPIVWELEVVGVQSGQPYCGDPIFPDTTLLVAIPTTPITVPVDVEFDSQVDVTIIQDTGLTLKVDVAALFSPEAPGQFSGGQLVTVGNGFVNPEGAPFHSVVANVTPAAASITIPAAANLGVQLIYCTFTYDNRSGAAAVQGIRVWNGVPAGGDLLWFSALQAAAGTVTRYDVPPGVQSDHDVGMTVDFTGGAAAINESIALGYRYSPFPT